jgi:hypothetical protein
MPSKPLSVGDYDVIERAVARGERLTFVRRGSPLPIVAGTLTIRNGREVVVGTHPSTGEPLTVFLDEIDGVRPPTV